MIQNKYGSLKYQNKPSNIADPINQNSSDDTPWFQKFQELDMENQPKDQSKSAERAIDNVTAVDQPVTTEDFRELKRLVKSIDTRLIELEQEERGKLPVVNLAPKDDINVIRNKVNQIINYLNIGVRDGG